MLQIVIPAYNEERRLPRTLRELRRHVAAHRGVLGRVEVIVVDNASTDATAQVARAADCAALPVRVVSCARRGKGAAVRAGLLETVAEVVCFMDADGATGLDALEMAWASIAQGVDVVIGSRAHAESVTSARHCRTRSRGAAVYRRFARRMVPDVSDTQCGFKVFRGDVARAAVRDQRAVGFSFDVELLVRCAALSARVEEIPVQWVDVPGSTFVPARHGASAFLELAGIAWRTRAITSSGRAVAGRRTPLPMPAPAALPATLGAAVVVPLLLATTDGERRPR